MVHDERPAQLLFGIEQRVSHKEQRNIGEKEFEAQSTEYQTGGRRIKHLQHTKPNKKKKRHQERRPEDSSFFPARRNEKGKINDGEKSVLGEIDRHIVPEKFSRKIFKQEPGQEEIDTIAPAIEHGHD